MKNLKLILLTVLVIVAGPVIRANAQTWQVANSYSVAFSCDEASGIFTNVKASIIFDEQNLNSAKFSVNIDAGSMNTGNALMNKHAKSDEWLDAGKYPSITFASKKVVKNGGSYQVTGDLTLHGVTKEVSIPFSFKRAGSSATFTGNFNLKRSDFNIGKPGGKVDENVKINLSVPVNKA
ncbi:YceI family protein [Mucilaginibacter sp. X4EP1]|uniref:YceI family protein n=1 Tax=Mucilaginibacter sp. X4EP1 TaxID=2723092 RepID=UPI002169675B|nr:YceI family protein [Mucilaginibacter sp. X4EP1]MCS3811999.1 polyisoprenoid-binding protein YceI [Mucilaginibacter sp. X4EP1]